MNEIYIICYYICMIHVQGRLFAEHCKYINNIKLVNLAGVTSLFLCRKNNECKY